MVGVLAAAMVAGAPASGAAQASGEPVRVGVIYTAGVSGVDLPGIPEGAKAGAKYLNKELGGFGGRPVEIVACNDRGDPARDVACAQDFVSKDVLAVIGMSPVFGDNGLKVIGQAGIPFVGQPISNAEFLDAMSYPLGGGAASAFPSLAKYLVQKKKVKKVAILYADLAAGKLAADALLATPLKDRGVASVTQVAEKIDAPDFSSALVQANDGNPDAIVLLFDAATCARIFSQAKQVGIAASKFATSGACADPRTVVAKVPPDAVNGVTFTSDTAWKDPKNADAKVFRSRYKRYGKKEADGFTALNFAHVVTLGRIVDSLGAGAVTSAALLDKLKTETGVKGFMSGTLDSSRPAELAGVPTHVFNRDQRIIELCNGKFVDIGGGWVDGFE